MGTFVFCTGIILLLFLYSLLAIIFGWEDENK